MQVQEEHAANKMSCRMFCSRSYASIVMLFLCHLRGIKRRRVRENNWGVAIIEADAIENEKFRNVTFMVGCVKMGVDYLDRFKDMWQAY